MRALLAGATAVFAALTALAGPASAIDADGRMGDDDPGLPALGLLAPLRPSPGCLLVNVIPVGWTDGEQRTLLFRPCDPPVVVAPYEPFDDRPPILVPAAPGR